MVVRNLFTVLGILAVFAVFFLAIRPEWIKQIASSPTAPTSQATNKVNARLSAERLRQADLPKDKGGFLQVDETAGADAGKLIVEEVGEDLPSRNSPYLLIVNKSTNAMRHCRLGSSVRKIGLKIAYPDVRIQEVPTTPGGPYQVIIWIPQATDLQLEIDVAATSTSRS